MSENTTPRRALALGVGGAGASVIAALKRIPSAKWLSTAVIDTDSSALENHPADIVLPAAADWILRDGAGCGGDVIRGERALARERANIAKIIQGYDLVVVAAGLGGGTATGGIRTVASIVRSLGAPSVFLLTTPFSFESFSRSRNAEECINELLPLTDILLTLPNDLLFSKLPPDTPAARAFELSAMELARTVSGVASLLRARDLIGTDYATFLTALRGHRCVCGVGIGVAQPDEGLDRTALALERMLESPFLGGLDRLKKADAAILIMTGGPGLTLAEMKRSMEQGGALLSQDTESILGVSVSPEDPEIMQMTAIAVQYLDCDEKKTRARSKWRRPAHPRTDSDSGDLFELRQGELGLTSFSRGVFERMPVVKYRDVDLDVPTFQRRNLTIDKGS